MLSPALLDEVDNNTDDILVSDILYIILGPLESEEGDFVDISGVGYLFSCTVDDVSDLVVFEEL